MARRVGVIPGLGALEAAVGALEPTVGAATVAGAAGLGVAGGTNVGGRVGRGAVGCAVGAAGARFVGGRCVAGASVGGATGVVSRVVTLVTRGRAVGTICRLSEVGAALVGGSVAGGAEICGTGERAPWRTTALKVASGVGCCSGELSAESTRPRQQPVTNSTESTAAITVIRLADGPRRASVWRAFSRSAELGVTLFSIRRCPLRSQSNSRSMIVK